MNYENNEEIELDAQACEQTGAYDEIMADFDLMCSDPDADGGETLGSDQTSVSDRIGSIEPSRDCRRTVCINFPPEISACYGTAGVEVTARDFLTWCAAANRENADTLIAIRDGFYSEREEDFSELDLFEDTWGPHGPEERATARVAHAKGEAERLARRAAIEAQFARDDAEAVRKDAEEAIKWAPFAEERSKLKTEQEALFDRADELDRQWERFVIERGSWGGDRAVREEARRAELTNESAALVADEEAWWGRWGGLYMKVEEAWNKRQSK